MKLIFIRHGDPDYEQDGLTEQGKREAELLKPRIPSLKADEYYVSPLGRAKQTAQIALEGTGIEPEVKEWLKEFAIPVTRPGLEYQRTVPWDWLPQYWTKIDGLYDADKWMDDPVMAEAGMREKVKAVTDEFDRFLAEHGYVREGRMYKAVRPNNDTIVFFCHFGLMSLLFAHLISASAMTVWQGFICPPSSVTVINTEERTPGNVQWRCSTFGDTSHLYKGGMEPGFSGRFCECYTNTDERH
jgi:probable phosphoglycerate mutase